MKIFIALMLGGILGAIAVYIPVYMPERERRVAVEAERDRAGAELAETRALLRLRSLQDRLADRLEQSQDAAAYDDALRLSTRFFDLVRDLATSASGDGGRRALAAVLERRDAVTAALARRDPAVRAQLRDIRASLAALGAPPAEADATEATAATGPAAARP